MGTIAVTTTEVMTKLGGTLSDSGPDWALYGYSILNETVNDYTSAHTRYYTGFLGSAVLADTDKLALSNDLVRYECAVDVLNLMKGKTLETPSGNLSGFSMNTSNFFQILDNQIMIFKEKITQIKRIVLTLSNYNDQPTDKDYLASAGLSFNEDRASVM